MPAKMHHFSINADNVERARTFYESVFDWKFESWGPPDFYIIDSAVSGVGGALQARRELVPGAKMLGFEATMAVADIPATIAAVEAGGGRIVMQPYRIPGVGDLIMFEDTEGNLVGAMRYDEPVDLS